MPSPRASFHQSSTYIAYSYRKIRDVIRDKHGVHPISDLGRRPIICKLPKHKIEVSGSYIPPQEHGYCAAAASASVSISIDGEEVTNLDGKGLGGCEAGRFLVEIDAECAVVCATTFVGLVWGDKKNTSEPIECKVVKSFPIVQ